MDWRGNFDACASTAEKSRHFRQEFKAAGFGFEAWMAARFGREDNGIGGGAPFETSVFPFGLCDGMGGGISVDLLSPNSNADLLGGGLMTFWGLIVF